MSWTTYANQQIQNALLQAAALGAPSTWYVGLLAVPNPAGIWTGSTSYATGAYAVPSTFSSIAGQQGKIFKATTGGTSGGSEPAWPTGEGATVTDNTVTWTEASTLFQAGTFTGAEPSGSNYGRVGVAASSANFSGATNAEPSVSYNATGIVFPTPSAGWGYAVGAILCDAVSAGNVWNWAALLSPFNCAAGVALSLPANGLALQLSALLTA